MNHDLCTARASSFKKIFSNICEVTGRNDWVALVTDAESAAEAEEGGRGGVPRADSFVPAYHVVAKEEDVDQPRNLAKSVTIERDRRYGRLCPHRKKKNQKKKKMCGTVRALARIEKEIEYYEHHYHPGRLACRVEPGNPT